MTIDDSINVESNRNLNESVDGNLTAHLDAAFSRTGESKKSNRSVLFIGHNIYHVYDISDRFVILDRGEVVHQLNKNDISTPEELMKIMRDTIGAH